MSADNGLYVAHVENTMDRYGIWHYFASMDDYPPALVDNAYEIFDHPLKAIIAAHRLQKSEQTEYGVYVTVQVLYDAEHSLASSDIPEFT